MICTLCLAIILTCGSVHGFRFQSSSSQFLELRQKSLLSQHILPATTATQTAIAAFNPKVASISIGSLGRSIAILAKKMKCSMGLFMRSTLEKKIVVVAYPLTVVLLYLFFTSTVATVQSRKLFCSFSNFLKSYRKKDSNISALSASLAMGKSEDVAATTLIQNSIDDTRDDIVEETSKMSSDDDIAEETSKMSSDASIAQARRDVELKLAAIVENEEKMKLMKEMQVSQVQQTLVAAQSIEAVAVVFATPIKSNPVMETAAPALVLIAAENEKEVVKKQTIMDISDSALQVVRKPMIGADAAAATFFAIAIGSPVFQPMMNFFHDHVHLIK
jgi:hypothetical protein